jgi:hypothetical protein
VRWVAALGARIWRSLWHDEEILILAKQVTERPSFPEGELVEHAGYGPAVAELYRRLGRGTPEGRLRARYRHGLRLYELRQGDRTLATIWIVPPGERFVDEIGYAFRVPEGDAWLRDGFVPLEGRGRRSFARLLDAVLSRALPGTRTLWSDVPSDNAASLKAHAGYGFEVVDALRALHVAGLLLIRRGVPERIEPVSGYRPGRRLLYTGRAYRRYRSERLA